MATMDFAMSAKAQDYHQRLASVRDCRVAVIEDAAHMVHHDQPLQLAALIEEFLG